MPDAQHVAHTPEITVFCEFNETPNILDLVIRERLADDPVDVWFPCLWGDSDGVGGPPISDMAMLYVQLPGDYGGDSAQYAVSLEALVDEVIAEAPDTAICRGLAARLRELATKLDASV